MKKLVILGGGFAGVWAALGAIDALRRSSADRAEVGVTLVSRDPWLTIRPRLYEANLEEVRVPLDPLLRHAGIERVEGEIVGIDAAERTVAVTHAGGRVGFRYDRLVVASGSVVRRAEIQGAAHLLTVDTYADAIALERHIAALAEGPRHAARHTAVIAGAGFTGLEVATELVGRLRAVSGGEPVRVVLVEAAATVAPDLGPAARHHVEQALELLGIERRVGRRVIAIEPGAVTLNDGECIQAATTVWTAGFHASSLGGQLRAPRDAAGRVHVDELLRVQGIEGIYAAGDVARAMADSTHVAPMSCQHAIPMGERAGTNAVADLLGRPGEPYSQPNYVTCLDLGMAGALFMEGWERSVRLTGFWAKVMKETINRRLIYPKSRDTERAQRPQL